MSLPTKKRKVDWDDEKHIDYTAIPCSITPSDVTLDRVLGKGNFGTVYKGTCRGKDVAIKVLEKQQLTEQEAASFLQEVSIIRNNPHPNIVQFLGACTIPGNLMIVTELLPLGDLHDLLIRNANPNLTLIKRLRMALDTALGMNWLHESKPQFIHRDLKVHNLLVDENLRIKICDFGFAQVKNTEYLQDPKNKGRGSPLWTAPEIFLNKPFNEKCDVYSFGLILWSLVEKRLPFNHIQNIEQLFNSVVRNKERPPINGKLHDKLKALIGQCWNDNPNLRPAFSQIIIDLREIIFELSITNEKDREFWKATFNQIEYIDREFHDIESFTLTLQKTIRKHNKHATLALEKLTSETDICKLSDEDLNTFSVSSLDNCRLASLEFMRRYGERHYIASDEKLDAKLFKLIAETPEREKMTSLERFGTVLKWFGPIIDPRTNQIHLISRMKWTVDFDWFHGDLSKEEAEERLMSSDKPVFLVRFSSIPGQFTYSSQINGAISHRRIEHKDDGFAISLGVGEKVMVCRTLGFLIKKYNESLNNISPCPGLSRYRRELLKSDGEVSSGYFRSNYDSTVNISDDADIVMEEIL